MEINKIYNGNAYDLIKQIPDKSVDLIMTDPPYDFNSKGCTSGIFKHRDTLNSTYNEIESNNISTGIDLSILDEFVRVLKKINCYIWCNKEQIYDYLTYFVKERHCNWEMIIWAKTNPPPFVSGHYLKDKEYCLYFWETGVKVKPTFETGKTVYLTNINIEDKKKYGHPTIKDIEIIKTLISNSCGGGIVLDPFVGSGTTCCASKELGLDYIGFELNEEYYKVATDRLNGITKSGQTSLLETNFEQLDLFKENT